MRFAIAALVIASVSCSGLPTEPASSDRILTLRYGHTATVGETRISFADISDSRCAKDVVCAWEGDAAPRLESGSESVVLHTSRSAGPRSGTLRGLAITLVDVEPERLTAGEPPKSAYTITLRVTG